MNVSPSQTPDQAVPHRRLGGPLVSLVAALLLALALMQGESWVIAQAPVLLAERTVAWSAGSGCAADAAEAGILPVAVLH